MVENKIYSPAEISKLYDEIPHVWLLLEVVAFDKTGKVGKMKLLSYSKNKDDLYDLLMEDESWDLDKKHIFVYTDPDEQGIINYSKKSTNN